jgi:hypothetical protein
MSATVLPGRPAAIPRAGLGAREAYLRARSGGGAFARLATAVALVLLTAAMGLGILVAAQVMWLPRL